MPAAAAMVVIVVESKEGGEAVTHGVDLAFLSYMTGLKQLSAINILFHFVSSFDFQENAASNLNG